MSTTSSGFTDIDLRYSLSNELHARPFPEISEAGHAFCVALRSPDSSPDTREKELAHLIALLDLYNAPHPPQGANHYYGPLGRYFLKWERHTEFLTYTVFSPGTTTGEFPGDIDLLPMEWRAAAPGQVVTAAQIYVDVQPIEAAMTQPWMTRLGGWFERESLAVSAVLDQSALVASDFRIAANGFVRFAVIADPTTGPNRLGRIVQRIFEIETYKSMAMLSLPAARDVAIRLDAVRPAITSIANGFTKSSQDHEVALTQLLDISGQLEELTAQNAARFSAATAYTAIVNQRIEVLREIRVEGRQTIAEFMMRRFDPAMRTCASTSARLSELTSQTARAGDMLRTRTDVIREEQNQAILERMDARADQQLKLQKTVEGLSVVAISYYAVNLVAYVLTPFSDSFGLSKPVLSALITVPVVLGVWLMVRKIRNHL